MGISENFGLSFYKATLSAGVELPDSGLVFISVNDEDKFKIIPIVRGFIELGFNIIATSGTAHEIVKNGMIASTIFKVGEGRPNIVDRIINTESFYQEHVVDELHSRPVTSDAERREMIAILCVFSRLAMWRGLRCGAVPCTRADGLEVPAIS